MVTYTYKLYETKRTAKLEAMFREACFAWNHALALQKRYYSLYGKYIVLGRMKNHFVRRFPRKLLHTHTRQEVLERLDAAYQRFFKGLSARPPKFRKAECFSSIVFKGGGGYRLEGNELTINRTGMRYRFFCSRSYEGNVRELRVLRSRAGRWHINVVTDAAGRACRKTHDGASVGMDWGVATFLTLSDGTAVESPAFIRADMESLRRLSRNLSRCVKGSNNRAKRRVEIARLHERAVSRRADWQWKTCHELCRRYDVICIEELNLQDIIDGVAENDTYRCMRQRRLMRRKMYDLACGEFMARLRWTASKYGVEVVEVPHEGTSETCSACGHVRGRLTLPERRWVCPECGASHDRDLNASINILRQGIASSGSTRKTVLARQGASATGESPLL